MHYLLLIYGNEAPMLAASTETAAKMIAAYAGFTEAMKKAGVYVGSNRLQPTASATTVRAPNGKTKTVDGPFAETNEQLGGPYMIEAPDLNGTFSWAARCLGVVQWAVEVRPIWAT